MSRDPRAAAIVDYWHAVEMFSPQAVPRVDRAEGVSAAQDEHGRAPWSAGHRATEARLKTGQTWRHQVFCGLFDTEAVSDVLADLVGGPRDSSERRSTEKAALASFVVTAEGLVVPGSLVVSTCAWAVGRATTVERRDSTWLTGFDVARESLEDVFAEITGTAGAADAASTVEDTDPGRPASPAGSPGPEARQAAAPVGGADDRAPDARRPLTIELVDEIVQLFAERLSVDGSLAPRSFRVRTTVVRRNDDTEADFLNSFYLDDLRRVRDALDGGSGVGAALSAYLHPPSAAAVSARIDVRTRLGDVAARLAPPTIPSGRWPASPGQSLAASQQLAISTTMQELARTEGVFAVNGPPGTGKTTMLRDLVAAVVTERAAVLARLTSPGNAFTDQTLTYTSSDGYARSVTVLSPDLVGHEVVVASSNNAAVENVSREIPSDETVKDWPDPTPYFRDLAQLSLDAQEKTSKQARPVRAWAFLAAPLGNSANRRALHTVLLHGNAYDEDRRTEPVPGLRQRLTDYESGAPRPSWADATKAFSTASKRVETLRGQRSRHASDLVELDRLRRRSADLSTRLDRARSATADAADVRRRADGNLVAARTELVPLEAALADRRSLKPGFWSNAVSLGRTGADWRDAMRPLVDDCEAARRKVADAQRAASSAAEGAAAAQSAQDALEVEDAALTADVVRLERRVVAMHEVLGVHDPGDWGQRADRERELGAPWLDPELNEARSRLFLAALDVHEAWIANAGPRFRKNVLAATDLLNGAIPKGNRDAVRAAWQSLFLVVPVVSTTFASVDRMFAGLGSEDLGWLVVDEAGQATPQAPVGALWRTKRAVVVGDPLQLEPVFSLKDPAQELLRRLYDVDPRWMQSRSSLQTLADQLCRYGTDLHDSQSGDVRWVGAPLRVHRRCIEPMFSIANDLAYGGDLMISAAVEKAGPDLPPSCWFDVGGPSEGHWRPDQGDLVITMLVHLVATVGLPPTEIRVISPFRTVANRLRDSIATRGNLRGVRAGTVHTTPGQEASVVLLVLGGDPQSPGAKRFATAKPNLLNVAVTRAQRRFYVVGDRQDWIGLPQFMYLRDLPVR